MFRPLINPQRVDRPREARAVPPALAFHRRLPGYAPTPLRALPGVARNVGVSGVWVKDETNRLGLPSFKILGTGWAAYRSLEAHGGAFGSWATLAELRAQVAERAPVTLVTATDGNHGHALAWFAHEMGLPAHIVVPDGVGAARIASIEALGAVVTRTDLAYDDAVTLAGSMADDTHLVVSDTTWNGNTQTAEWVVDGYATIMAEIDEALCSQVVTAASVVVQVGVGGLAAAVARHFGAADPRPQLVSVEPNGAACMLESAAAGHLVAAPGPHPSRMVGLNCDLPSSVAWPDVSECFDVFVEIGDDLAEAAMRTGTTDGIEMGESGAAGIGALIGLVDADPEIRRACGLDEHAHVVVFATEGATQSS